MDQLRRDIGFAIRVLVKRPGLSFIIILTLSLGIGVTTTVFSWVNGALYKGLPVPAGERVVAVGTSEPARNIRFNPVSVHDFVEWREQQTTLADLASFNMRTVNLSGSEARPERYSGAFVSANLFDLLRVQPVLGSFFREGDDRPGADPVIVIGYTIWQDRYGAAPDVIGRTVRANGTTRTIIGVAPEGFLFPDREQLWIPEILDPNASARGEGPMCFGVGRLRDVISLDDARAEFATIARRLEQEYPETNEGIGAAVMAFTELGVGPEMYGLMLTMVGAVIGVLLIACANVANLLLARASVRTREVAVRTALGARRARIITQFMTELLILSIIGGGLGYVLGRAGVEWGDRISVINPPPFWIRFDSDHRVVLFVISMVVLSCIVSGLVPAFRATGVNVNEALKDEGRGSSSFRMGKFSAGLVVTEVALSCGLLVLAGLMVKSVARLKTQDLPFATENIFTARLRLLQDEYRDAGSRIRFYDELLPRLRAIPGVEAATLSDGLPAAGYGLRRFEIEGESYGSEEDLPIAREGIVTPGYFETFQTPVLAGRTFNIMDRRESLPVAIVNETFVRTFFTDGDPLGRRLRIAADSAAQWMTVVGVVPDMKMEGIENLRSSPAGYYTPIAQSPVGTRLGIAIRTRGAPTAFTAEVRSAVESVDPDLAIYDILSMEDVITRETWFYWFFGSTFMVFGFVALFLAAVGLYGVMSFAVSRRTQEMGIRMALGADGPTLVRLVMKRGLIQLSIGLTLGIGLAALGAGPLQFFLYEVSARDPAVFGAVLLALALTGLLASFVPARRVTRVDPVTALTAE